MADGVDLDTGEPIAELADIGEEPAPGFLGRLWRRIDRRRLGGELADLTWHGLFSVFREYLVMLFGLLEPRGSRATSDADKGETE